MDINLFLLSVTNLRKDIWEYVIFGVALWVLMYIFKIKRKDPFETDDSKFTKRELQMLDADPNNERKPRDADFVYVKNKTDEITAKIKNHDPDFHRGRFIIFAKNLFVTFFEHFENEICDKVTILDTDELYKIFANENAIANNKSKVSPKMEFKFVFFSDYSVKDGFEYITVIFYVQLFDPLYKQDPYRQFTIRFARFTNNLISYVNVNGSVTCPNCGGSGKSIITDGVCEYCGATITLGGYNFVFAGFKKILKDEDIYAEMPISPLLLEKLEEMKKRNY